MNSESTTAQNWNHFLCTFVVTLTMLYSLTLYLLQNIVTRKVLFSIVLLHYNGLKWRVLVLSSVIQVILYLYQADCSLLFLILFIWKKKKILVRIFARFHVRLSTNVNTLNCCQIIIKKALQPLVGIGFRHHQIEVKAAIMLD